MKRKLLLRFADWLEKSRTPFNITHAKQCVSQHALRFADKFDLPGQRKMFRDEGSGSEDLMAIFNVPRRQAAQLFSRGFNWSYAPKITRKVAAKVVRELARTGKVNFGKFREFG